jgi:lipopolysaccharide biosynthesis protein
MKFIVFIIIIHVILIVRLITFYLPQFYENEINNKNWGKGFTEWTNVKRSIPLYYGHHQPRLPTELGYYNLENDEIRHQQAKLAKEYGVDAWCYYYYRFNGQRVLETPLNRHIQDKRLDMPFLICWANESWTRTWDAQDKNILIKQQHNFEDDLNFIKDISQMLMDTRYVKINNKPVILIYRTELWNNIEKTVKIWRNYMLKNFNTEIYLIRCNSFDQNTNPTHINFDASYQFPPFGLSLKHYSLPRAENGKISFYNDWPRVVLDDPQFKLFRGVLTSFDNTPRTLKQNKDLVNMTRPALNPGIFYGSSPFFYQKWLESAMKYTLIKFKKEEQLIFINAWNEWGEGAVLEPCNQWGKQYLVSTLKARHNLNL